MLNPFFAAATLLAALMLVACGGEDSPEPQAEVRASADTAPARVDEQQPPAGARPVKKSKQAGNPDSRENRKAKGQGPNSADAGSGPGSGQGANDNEPKSGAKSKPKKPKQTQPPLPPQFAGKSIYELARETCGDPGILEFIPEDQRDNPEQLADMARSFAPPGKEQEAHDGCLAGLHSIGL